MKYKLILPNIHIGSIIEVSGKEYVILSFRKMNGYYEYYLTDNYVLDIIPENFNEHYRQPENCTIKNEHGHNLNINAKITIIKL